MLDFFRVVTKIPTNCVGHVAVKSWLAAFPPIPSPVDMQLHSSQGNAVSASVPFKQPRKKASVRWRRSDVDGVRGGIADKTQMVKSTKHKLAGMLI